MPSRGALALTAAASAVTVELSGRLRLAGTRRTLRKEHVDALARVPSTQRQDAIVAVLTERADVIWPHAATPITDLVHAQLAEDDVASVVDDLAPDLAGLYAAADPATQRRIALNFAAANGVEDVLERAGISAAMPPEDVHAMGRGPVAAGGDFYLADLLFDALDHADFPVRDGGTILDFGGSSGRVLRAILAGRGDLAGLGCDPNEQAIAWASEHLQGARFFVSPQRPPLPLEDASLDLAFAVSIWSHFAEEPALAWFREMHRVLAPGRPLLITTHGLDCLSTQLRRGQISAETAASAAAAVLQGRHHFVDIFGPEGDWGVKDTGWGNAYFSLEWLLANTGDDWAVRLCWPGALDQVQDVIVLERR